MQNTIVITHIENLGTETFYTVEHMENRTDKIEKETLLELVRHGVDVEMAEEFDEINLTYIEIAHSVDSDNDEIDVYSHEVYIHFNTGLKYNASGKLLKTYKRESSAINFANKQNAYMVV